MQQWIWVIHTSQAIVYQDPVTHIPQERIKKTKTTGSPFFTLRTKTNVKLRSYSCLPSINVKTSPQHSIYDRAFVNLQSCILKKGRTLPAGQWEIWTRTSLHQVNPFMGKDDKCINVETSAFRFPVLKESSIPTCVSFIIGEGQNPHISALWDLKGQNPHI